MENATKALLIAAAILIAIVVITLGVFVLGKGSTLVKENSDMSDVEISTYNAEFETYCGNNVRGAQVRQLVSAVNQHNKSAEDDSKKIILTGIFGTDTTPKDNYSQTIAQTGYSYKVEVPSTGYNTGGLIKEIKVTQN